MMKIMKAEMNGWEFLEMVKKLRWKRKTGRKTYEWHYGDSKLGERSILNSVNYNIKRRNFIGWEYWFDRPYPYDCFDERTVIYYKLPESRDGYNVVEHFLEDYGFQLVDDEERKTLFCKNLTLRVETYPLLFFERRKVYD